MQRKLSLQWVALDELRANARNVKDHDVGAIEQSFTRFGLVAPVVLNERDGTLLAGHGRVDALRAIRDSGEAPPDGVKVAGKVWSVQVVRGVDLDEREAQAYLVADNRTTELGGWLEADLADLLRELDQDGGLAGTGFDLDELDELVRSLADDAPPKGGLTDPDAVPEVPEQSYVQRGEVYVLGEHRLMCGDSTDPEDVARLMAGERATLLATDPPYLVDYQGGNHPQSWANKAAVKDKHWDDYHDPDAASGFFADFLRVWLAHCIPTVPVYQWHATRRQALVEAAWQENGLLVHQTIIWVKARAVLTRSDYMWQHEPCFYGWPQGHRPKKKPPANATTVWEINQQGESDGIHPTQEPVELFARPVQYHTKPGDICAEPFSGSGTQIIAAEQQGRRCFAMELEPKYVQVAIERWEAFTGLKAEREAL